jgi:hypothetical protein
METLKAIAQLIGTIVIAGGFLSIFIYQIFKYLGAKWLDSKFEARLQALKHSHDKELEALRYKIAGMLDRTAKLHQREFEVLPEAWTKLYTTYWNAIQLISPLQERPDFQRMTALELDEFIEKWDIPDSQKQGFRKAQDKGLFYREKIDFIRLNKIEHMARDIGQYIGTSGIFISPAIRTEIEDIIQRIWKALIEFRTNIECPHASQAHDSIGALYKSNEKMESIKKIVYERLWSTEIEGKPQSP